MSESSCVYELITIGAGPAGITAAIYAAQKKMYFIILTTIIGGQACMQLQFSLFGKNY